MNSGWRNCGNYNLLDKYGTYPGRSICWEKPLSPHLASPRTERDVSSRRGKGDIPYIMEDSFDHWQVQPRCAWNVPWTNSSMPIVAKYHQDHRDRGILKDLGKWESSDGMEKYHVEKKMTQKAKEEWNFPVQLKRPLISPPKHPRRLLPLPLLCEPTYQQWAPQYIRDLLPVNQAGDSRTYREQWPRAHGSHRDASDLSENRQVVPLIHQSVSKTPPSLSSSESKGSRQRPAKPPSYETYLQMKKKAEQGKKLAEGAQQSQPTVQRETKFTGPSEQAARSERDRRPSYDLSALNVKAANPARGLRERSGRNGPTSSEAEFHGSQNHFLYLAGETTGSKCTKPERSGRLLTRPGYGTWHALDKYLYPGGSRHQNKADHASGRSAKSSELKHEALKAQEPGVELNGRAGRGDPRNRIKGEVLRSKKGEVVFCLISRPETGQVAPGSTGGRAPTANALPEMGRNPITASKSPDPRQTPLAKDERRFREGRGEIEGSESSNAEAMKSPCRVRGAGFSIKQELHSDGSTCRNIYDDIENNRARGRLYFSSSDHYSCPGNKEEAGSRVRQQPCHSDGEEVPVCRNSDRGVRGLDVNNSSQILPTRQKEKREAGLHVKGCHWGRGPVKYEMGKTAFFPNDRSLGNPTDKEREWYGRGKSPFLGRRARAVPLESGEQNLSSNRSTRGRTDGQKRHRERNLPECKQPIESSVGAGDRVEGECAKWGPECDGVFIIDATCAIVRAEYIASPKKERERFSQHLQVAGFRGSFEASARPDSQMVSQDQGLREEIQERNECTSLGRKLWHVGVERYSGDRLAESDGTGNVSNPGKKQGPFLRARVKESMKERATRILGLPIVDGNLAEVRLQATGVTRTGEAEDGAVAGAIRAGSRYPHTDSITEKRSGPWTGNTVDTSCMSEEIIQGVKRGSVEPTTVPTLQSFNTARDSLGQLYDGDVDSAAGDKTGIQQESTKDQEVSGESSFLLVELSPSTKGAEVSEIQRFHNLQDMVFQSVSRIRRHTAPDSESDDEEVERLLANDVLNLERDIGGNETASRGSTDSSTSADTVIACDLD